MQHLPDHRIRIIRIDNAMEFRSNAFSKYCEANGITVSYSVPYEHETNGIAEAYVKKITYVQRTILVASNLGTDAWALAYLHANALLEVWPHTALHYLTPHETFFGEKPSLLHFRPFGCEVYVLVPPELRTKLDDRSKRSIYIGFISRSVVKVIDIHTNRLIAARFQHCTFNEDVFPKLDQSLTAVQVDITDQFDEQYASLLITSMLEQRYSMTRNNADIVQRHQPSTNASENVSVSNKRKWPQVDHSVSTTPSQNNSKGATVSVAGEVNPSRISPSKSILNSSPTVIDASDDDVHPRKVPIKTPKHVKHSQIIPPENYTAPRDVAAVDINLPRTRSGKTKSNFIDIADFADDITIDMVDNFSIMIAGEVIPKNVAEAQKLPNWKVWRDAIHAEYQSLDERGVFSSVMELPTGKTLIGNRLILTIKTEPSKRYKARLVAQGFSQKYGQDYTSTYSPVLDIATYRYLIGIATQKDWAIHAMDVQTAYLYGDLLEDIYMKVPDGLHTPDHIRQPCVKLQKSLYGLKQSGRQWYSKYAEVLKSEGFTNCVEAPSVFFQNTEHGPSITSIYVDDTNIMGPTQAISHTKQLLKNHFAMKDFNTVTACIGVEIIHTSSGTFIHQSKMVSKILEIVNLEYTTPCDTPLQVRNVLYGHDIYRALKDDEEVWPYNTAYRSYIGMLSYLANTTRPDISFSVSLLARFTSRPGLRHYNAIKQVCQYLKKTHDYGLFYKKNDNALPHIQVYADAGHRSDSRNAKSQTGYVCLINGTAFHWRSIKQTLSATSSFESELIALYEASREIPWLVNFTKAMENTLKIPLMETPITVYEDNLAAMNQVKDGYIRSNSNKHIDPKVYRTRDLIEDKMIVLEHVSGDENPADLLTKTLPANLHFKYMRYMGLVSQRSLSRSTK
ncbi:DNA-directed DNA polymerase [Synchytrium microbalum]|uniref:DNA-directed DNA polymerase n=1 Tax=Synchytrium microbalum TaxID=1806994 RepID=A0A507BR27_9FUNG|nr:DNA-directed DNA polymerase [Synchytrium microbalum]TPX30028.1 DNA-directed DNA polymerase [Synchytrium microbalum]